MSRIDDIFDVGRQHEAHEGGMWVRSDTCVTCNVPIPEGSSWCVWHHPAQPVADSRDRCLLCGRPLIDGIERATGICHLCRDRTLGTSDA